MIRPSRRFFRSAVLLFVFSATAITARAQAGPLAPALQQAIDHHIIAGAVALVADKDRVLDVEVAGCSSLATKAPMQPDNVFWIASMSKSITATILMMLADEGKLKIDDPVEKYLPGFKGQMVVEEKDKDHPHPPRHPITLKEILSHTSGLVLANEKTLKHTHSLKDDVAQYAKQPLRQEPGTKFEYNNCGIDTAGRVLEVISGQSFADFLQKRLLDPLGMKDTTFWPTAEQGKRLARTARFTADKTGLEEIKQDQDATPALIARLSEGMMVPPEVLADMGVGKIFEYVHHYGEPAGGLFSTAHDMGRFCRMLLNGGVFEGKRFLSADAIRQMSSDQTGDVMVNPQEAYGLGWFVKKIDAEGLSAGSYGHRGARRTVMWIDPKSQLVLVLLVERFDMTGEQQKELYTSVFETAVAKYGKAR